METSRHLKLLAVLLCVAAGCVSQLTAPIHSTAGDTELLDAVRLGDVEAVSRLLSSSADPNTHDGSDGANPVLRLAAQENSVDIVRLLLAAGATVDLKNRFDSTALMAAASSGANDALVLLIEAGADVSSMQGALGRNPILSAIAHHNYDGACILARSGADLETQGGEITVMTPLMLAASHESLSVVECLMEQGAEVNARSQRDGLTVLDFAVRKGNIEIINSLLSRGALSAEDLDGSWPP